MGRVHALGSSGGHAGGSSTRRGGAAGLQGLIRIVEVVVFKPVSNHGRIYAEKTGPAKPFEKRQAPTQMAFLLVGSPHAEAFTHFQAPDACEDGCQYLQWNTTRLPLSSSNLSLP